MIMKNKLHFLLQPQNMCLTNLYNFIIGYYITYYVTQVNHDDYFNNLNLYSSVLYYLTTLHNNVGNINTSYYIKYVFILFYGCLSQVAKKSVYKFSNYLIVRTI